MKIDLRTVREPMPLYFLDPRLIKALVIAEAMGVSIPGQRWSTLYWERKSFFSLVLRYRSAGRAIATDG
jgi:hypothetical protein